MILSTCLTPATSPPLHLCCTHNRDVRGGASPCRPKGLLLLLRHGECQMGGCQQHLCAGDPAGTSRDGTGLMTSIRAIPLGALPRNDIPHVAMSLPKPSVFHNCQGLRNSAGKPALPQEVPFKESINSCNPEVVGIKPRWFWQQPQAWRP